MTMQDPMSQMAAAQRLTIPQLQQALRNGTIDPQVGQLVLNSKINEDKRRKAAMVATAAAQAPAQPPVTQQNLAYGAGVDRLPSNLPVQGMASGGIIAFDEGGEVERFDEGGLTQAEFDKLTPEQQQQYIDVEVNRNRLKNTASFVGTPLSIPAKYIANAGIGLNNVLLPVGKVLGTADPLDKRIPHYNLTPEYGATNLTPAQYRASLPVGTPKPAPAVNPAVAANPAVVAQQADAEKPSASLEDKLSQLNEYFGGAGNAAAGSRTKGTPGIGGFSSKGYEVKPYTAAQKEMEDALAAEMNPATGNPYTYEEKAAERKARQEAAGIDFNLYGKQREELEGKKNLSDTRSRLNEAMPFFEAASLLGQAPKPGETTVTAFSRALAGAGKTKAEIMDKEEARQERIGDKLNALAVAQNQFNAAQFSGNDADLKEARNAIKASRKDLRDLGIKGVDQQNEAAKTMAELRSKENIAAMQEKGAWARLGKENATIQAITKAILNDNPNMSLSDAINKAYLTKSAGSVYGADTRANTAQITALANQKKDLLKSRPLLSTAVPAWEKQLKDIEMQIEALGGSAADNSGAVGGNTVDFSKLPK